MATGELVDRLTRHDPATGALDGSWLPTANGSRSVNDVAAADNNIYIGGDFSHVSGVQHIGYAQFTNSPPAPNLVSLTMFDNDANGYIDTVEALFDKTLAPCAGPCTSNVTLFNPPSGATLSSVTTSGSVATFNLTEGTGNARTSVGGFRIELPSSTGILATDGSRASFDEQAPADGAPPVALALSKTNAGTSGLPEAGDTYRINFSESLDTGSLPSTTTLSIVNGGGANNDQLTIAGVAQGSIDLGSNTFINSGQANFAAALTFESGSKNIRITLGSCSGSCGELTRGDRGTLTYVAASAIEDPAGNNAIGSITKTFRPF